MSDLRKWISVFEKMPKDLQPVIAYVYWVEENENCFCFGKMYNGRWYLHDEEGSSLNFGFEVSHWMPLPTPPKEETE